MPDSIHDLFNEMENAGKIHQKIIGQLERVARRNVIFYFANQNHPASLLLDHDVDLIEGMLRSVNLDLYDKKLDLGGPEALGSGSRLELLWRQSLWETIGGGTSEVMRSLVARHARGLGGCT